MPEAEGQPTKYQDDYTDLAYNYCLLGATDGDLAGFFDVCEATINNWKNNHPEFLESIKKGKDIADAEVVKSLFQRAKGYSHDEDKIFNDSGKALVVSTTKHYPPDTVAGIFWLKNRQSKNWRDKREVEATVNLHEDMLDLIDDINDQ